MISDNSVLKVFILPMIVNGLPDIKYGVDKSELEDLVNTRIIDSDGEVEYGESITSIFVELSYAYALMHSQKLRFIDSRSIFHI